MEALSYLAAYLLFGMAVAEFCQRVRRDHPVYAKQRAATVYAALVLTWGILLPIALPMALVKVWRDAGRR